MVKPHNKPANVERAEDEILIDGPDGITTSMTPDAALKTAQRLEDAAVEAIVERGRAAGGEEAAAPDEEASPN